MREDRDMNQTEVAKHLRVSQSTYSRYESGDLDVPSEALILLAQLYKTSVDYILELTDSKEPR